MTLPSSGQLSFSQIAEELNYTTPYANINLKDMSLAAGKSSPFEISNFYGFSSSSSFVSSELFLHFSTLNTFSYSGNGTNFVNIGISGSTYNHTVGSNLSFNSTNKYFTGNGKIYLLQGSLLNPLTFQQVEISTRGGIILIDVPYEYSHEVWIYVKTSDILTTNQQYFISNTGISGIGLSLQINASYQISTIKSIIGVNYQTTQTSMDLSWIPSPLLTDGWYHIVTTTKQNYSSTNNVPNSGNLYVNGNLVKNTFDIPSLANSYLTNPGYTSDPDVYPSFNTNNFVKPAIYRLYNKQLTSSEVLQNFNAEKSNFGL